MAKGWYWRGNVAYYDFSVNSQRYKGSLGIKKDSGDVDGKSPAERAEIETRNLIVQYEQNYSIEQIWEQTQKRLGTTKVAFTQEDIWDVFIKKGLSNAKSRRNGMYQQHLKQFIDWTQKKYPAIKRASQVTEDVAKEYITYMRYLDGAPATKNDKLTTLKMIFSNLGLAANPFKKIKPMPLTQIQREIFTPEQIHILFDRSSGWMRRLFITALATFQREEDCCLIKKSYIHLDINRIKFPFTYKTGQEISLPMLPLFREIVEEALNDPDNKGEYLFPDLAHLYQTNPGRIGGMVKHFFEEQGIVGTVAEVPGYAKKVSTLDVHSLRHTAAVMAILSGWPIPMVMKATGHRSLRMLMRYINHISEEQKENYFFQFGKGLPGMPSISEDNERKVLADLAYSLPLEEVKRLIESVRPAIGKAIPVDGLHLPG
jgi:integrase